MSMAGFGDYLASLDGKSSSSGGTSESAYSQFLKNKAALQGSVSSARATGDKGLIGFAEHTANRVGHDIWTPVSKALSIADLPRSAVVSLAEELGKWGRGDGSWSDLVNHIKQHRGVGQVLQDNTLTNDLPINVKRALGFAGDISADPLNALDGAGAVSKGVDLAKLAEHSGELGRAGELAVQAGDKASGALLTRAATKRAAVKSSKFTHLDVHQAIAQLQDPRVTQILGHPVDPALIEKALRRNSTAIKGLGDAREAAGIKVGLTYATPTGRHVVPGTTKLAEAVAGRGGQAFRATTDAVVRKATQDPAWAERVGHLETIPGLHQLRASGPDGYTQAAGVKTALAGQKLARQQVEADLARQLSSIEKEHGVSKLNPDLLRKAIEEPQSLSAAEQVSKEAIAGRAYTDFFARAHAAMTQATGRDLPAIADYLPHRLSEEYKAKLAAADGFRRAGKKVPLEVKRSLQDTIDQIAANGQAKFGAEYTPLFEGDPRLLARGYVKEVGKFVGNAALPNELVKAGLAKVDTGAGAVAQLEAGQVKGQLTRAEQAAAQASAEATGKLAATDQAHAALSDAAQATADAQDHAATLVAKADAAAQGAAPFADAVAQLAPDRAAAVTAVGEARGQLQDAQARVYEAANALSHKADTIHGLPFHDVPTDVAAVDTSRAAVEKAAEARLVDNVKQAKLIGRKAGGSAEDIARATELGKWADLSQLQDSVKFQHEADVAAAKAELTKIDDTLHAVGLPPNINDARSAAKVIREKVARRELPPGQKLGGEYDYTGNLSTEERKLLRDARTPAAGGAAPAKFKNPDEWLASLQAYLGHGEGAAQATMTQDQGVQWLLEQLRHRSDLVDQAKRPVAGTSLDRLEAALSEQQAQVESYYRDAFNPPTGEAAGFTMSPSDFASELDTAKFLEQQGGADPFVADRIHELTLVGDGLNPTPRDLYMAHVDSAQLAGHLTLEEATAKKLEAAKFFDQAAADPATASVAMLKGADQVPVGRRSDPAAWASVAPELKKLGLKKAVVDKLGRLQDAHVALTAEQDLLDSAVASLHGAREAVAANEAALKAINADIKYGTDAVKSARSEERALRQEASRLEKGAQAVENTAAASVQRLEAASYRAAATAAEKGAKAADLRVLFKSKAAEVLIADEWKRGLKELSIGHDLFADPEVSRIVDHMAAVATPPNVNAVLKVIDTISSRWRAWALFSPGYHARNWYGGVFNNALAGVDLKMYGQWEKAWHQYRKADHSVEAITDPEMRNAVDQFLRAGVSHDQGTRDVVDVAQPGAYSHGIGNASRRAVGKDAKLAVDKWDPSSLNFKPLELNFRAAERVETHLRGVLFADQIVNKGASVEEALAQVTKFHFDYGELSQFEKSTMKRITSFYTWTRKNFPLQVEYMLRRPGFYNRYSAAKRNLELGTPIEGIVPSYYGGLMAIHTPWKLSDKNPLYAANGEKGANLYLTPDLPFLNLNDVLTPAGLGAQLNPLIKTPIELFAGKQFYSGIPINSTKLKAVPRTWLPIAPLLAQYDGIGIGGHFGIPRTFDTKHGWQMSDADAYKVEQAMPLLGRLRRLAPSEAKYQKRAISSWLSFFVGASVRSNDTSAQAGEVLNRESAIKAAVDKWYARHGLSKPSASSGSSLASFASTLGNNQ